MTSATEPYDIYNRGGDIDRLGNIRRMPFIHRGLPGRASLIE